MSTRSLGRRATHADAPLLLGALLGAALAACASSGGQATPQSAPAGRAARTAGTSSGAADSDALYRRMGLLVNAGDLPFVGRLGYLAGPSPESTTVVLTVSLPASAISFSREAPQRFAGRYLVDAEIVSDGAVVHRFSSEELVRVTNVRETSRPDASVLFQETFRVPPGSYVLALGVRDAGSTRSGVVRRPIVVPRLDAGLSTPLPVLRGAARESPAAMPALVANARATYLFGRDSVAAVYVEAYGARDTVPLRLAAYGDGGGRLWEDTVRLLPVSDSARLAARLIEVPVGRLGIGVTELALARLDERAQVADSARLPVFVSFGAGLPVAPFEEMVDYLRWFTSASRLAALRGAPPERRGEAWRQFLQATDPDPTTPQHEGLAAYFARIAYANERFRSDGARGWLSDRGRVYVALGEPDVVWDPTGGGLSRRGQTIAWEYHRFRIRLVFQDVTGFGHWRLLPGHEDDFRAAFVQLHGT